MERAQDLRCFWISGVWRISFVFPGTRTRAVGTSGLGSFLSPEECRDVGVGCIGLVRVASSWCVCWIGECRVRSLWRVAKNVDFSNGLVRKCRHE